MKKISLLKYKKQKLKRFGFFLFLKSEKKKCPFILKKKTRFFSDERFVTYYFEKKEKTKKKWKPINLNNERMRMNIETGEVDYYSKKLCVDSRSASIRRSKIVIEELLSMNKFDWFVTLTFGDYQVHNRNDFDFVYKAYLKFVDNLKKYFPDVKYITFPEKHKEKIIFENFQEIIVKDNCYHFHMLLGNCNPIKLGFVNSGKVCCHWATQKNGICSKKYFEETKDKFVLTETDGLVIYNIESFKFGYSTASKIASKEKTNSYVKKYVEKAFGSTDLWKKRFFYSRNLEVPEKIVEILDNNCFVSDLHSNRKIIEEKLYQNDFEIQKKFNSDYNIVQYKYRKEIGLLIDKNTCQLKNGLLPMKEDALLKLFGQENIQFKMEL